MSDGNEIFDAVVIGGGIVGLSIAHALVELGHRVSVVERAGLGEGTSARSFAWINATSKVNSEAYHRLNASGLQAYLTLAREWGEKRIGLHRCGTLDWASPAGGGTLEALRGRAAKLESWGYPVAWLGTHELRAMEPHVEFAEDAEGLYALADPWLDVPVFVDFLATRIRAAGSTILEHTPAETLLVDDDGTVHGLVAGGRTLSTAQVVLAAGPSTPEVLGAITGYEGFSSRFPMQRGPGLLVTAPADPSRVLVRRILYDSDHHVHLRPAPGGGLLLGADETDGLVSEDCDAEAVRHAAVRLLEKTQAVVPAFQGAALIDACECRVGIRAVPADGDSIVGPLPESRGLFVVCTHSGITMGPAIGALAAAAVSSGTVPDVIAPFGLERFQL